MNEAIKKEWVAALRSGEYEQTKRLLRRRAGGFCCLGVLCDIHARHHPFADHWELLRDFTYDGSSVTLPRMVSEWAGIDSYDESTVAFMNDDNGESFQEISNYIEENL